MIPQRILISHTFPITVWIENCNSLDSKSVRNKCSLAKWIHWWNYRIFSLLIEDSLLSSHANLTSDSREEAPKNRGWRVLFLCKQGNNVPWPLGNSPCCLYPKLLLLNNSGFGLVIINKCANFLRQQIDFGLRLWTQNKGYWHIMCTLIISQHKDEEGTFICFLWEVSSSKGKKNHL